MMTVSAPEYGSLPEPFTDPFITADGSARASVTLGKLDTLWINTGTLCNLTCARCYIRSSPLNDSLSYITPGEVERYLDEIGDLKLGTRKIGITGGEPFMNPDILAILTACLDRGFEVLLLTNAMRPMTRLQAQLVDIGARFGDRLTVRVSLDHYTKMVHEEERGADTWEITLAGLKWLHRSGFRVSIAARHFTDETEPVLRDGFRVMLEELGIFIDTSDPARLLFFPEMDEGARVPEITTECWEILGVDPGNVMCATSRMVVKRKGAPGPVVVSCTLLPENPAFEFGEKLADALGPVQLNHPHCARFCVLGGGSCSASD